MPIKKALYNHVGTAEFNQNASTISGSLVDRTDGGYRKSVETEVTTLDHDLRGLVSGPIVIKLDIEGGEPMALDGMSNLLEEVASLVLFLEIHPIALCDAGFDVEDVISRLLRLGFRVDFIDEADKALIPVATPRPVAKGNLFCRRHV